jgi:hypothetical protein
MCKLQPAAAHIGKLKMILGGVALSVYSDIEVPWDIVYLTDHLRFKLNTNQIDLLAVLISVLNDPFKLTDLDQFPEWRDAPPKPLE